MLLPTHKPIGYTKYKELSKHIARVCDFVNLFATVNTTLIQEEGSASKFLAETTECLVKIEEIIRAVRLMPAKYIKKEGSATSRSDDIPQHTIWSYYFGLGDYERSQNDTIIVEGKVIKFPSERTLPIILQADFGKIEEMTGHIRKLIRNCQVSYEPVPLCRSRRTDCYLCFRPLFGSTKQMGLILARTFEGVRIDIPTGDGNNLDCMFFTSTCEPLSGSKYKSAPTFILCNPNAMFYQYMVN
jgi:hypothetical protein